LCADFGKAISISLVITKTFQGIAFGSVLPDLHAALNHLGEWQHNQTQSQQEPQHLCWPQLSRSVQGMFDLATQGIKL